MREANASLVAFLATRAPCFKADLFTITLADGSVYTWTSADTDLFVPPYTYYANGPVIDRTKWSVKNTLDVPEMEVRLFSDGTDLPDGRNLKLLVHNGLFDYATFLLSRIIMPTWGDTSLGAVDLFEGNVADVQIDALEIVVTAKGANHQLAQYMPRNQYMNSCIHSVYDAGCAPNPGQPGGGPLRSAYTLSNTVGAGSTRNFIAWGSGTPPNYAQFSLGYITFTSGTSAGLTRTIPAGQGLVNGVGLAYPLYTQPEVGDEYTVTYGCNRTRSGAQGCPFFNNTNNYRGFRFIPPAEFGA